MEDCYKKSSLNDQHSAALGVFANHEYFIHFFEFLQFFNFE
jgi:hypothetical protein